MTMVRRCDQCKNGINDVSSEDNSPYTVCALMPPQPVSDGQGGVIWVRPPMQPNGFCGQFKRDGART